MAVAEKYQHYGAIDSPAACPKCGSMDLTIPFQGRRTGLYLARCKDCGEALRSTIAFEISPPRPMRRGIMRDPDPQPMRPAGTTLMAAAIRGGQKFVDKWLPYRDREPGEEG
jgi:hypothetical protein